MEYQHSVSLKDSPLNSACVVENLYCYFKQIISYEKMKLKNKEFYATRWFIFAGPVVLLLMMYFVFGSWGRYRRGME